MAEDLDVNLTTYKVQLQQVEAALTTDPENEELNKLKKDLQEVIDLTEELIASQQAPDSPEKEPGPSSSSYPSSNPLAPSARNDRPQADEEDWKAGLALAAAKASDFGDSKHEWAVGEKCSALWSEDQQYYEATVDEILEDGTCTVTFKGYDHTEVTQVSQLKPLEVSLKRAGADADGPGGKRPKTKKDRMAAEREYKKKKAQKKAQRQKQLEEEREGEKNKWLDFNAKVFSKTNKGKVKKSIFATPESVQGRVGVGTCGVSGRPMTQFTHRDKWKK